MYSFPLEIKTLPGSDLPNEIIHITISLAATHKDNGSQLIVAPGHWGIISSYYNCDSKC